MAEREQYHHGDLRTALITLACEIVEAEGHDAVSMRALAESLGVTRGAPYRHFPERNELLAEVAAIGFGRLQESLPMIRKQTADPVERLLISARTFLGFVSANSRLYRLMFDSGLLSNISNYPRLAEAQRAVYEQINGMVTMALAGKHASENEVKLKTIAFWSTLFGYAKLTDAGLLQDYMTAPLTKAEIEDAILQASLGTDLLGQRKRV